MIKHCVEPVRAADSCWLVIMRTSFHIRGVMQSSLNMRTLIIATYGDKKYSMSRINMLSVLRENKSFWCYGGTKRDMFL